MNDMVNSSPLPSGSVDWHIVGQSVPFILLGFSWLLWAFFLVVPALFGLHYAHLFEPAHNALFVLMGLVLCMAASFAFFLGHVLRFLGFVFSVSLLAYWF